MEFPATPSTTLLQEDLELFSLLVFAGQMTINIESLGPAPFLL